MFGRSHFPVSLWCSRLWPDRPVPGFEGDQIEVEGGEIHTPSSLLNSRDSYCILVRNDRDLDTVAVQVILPEEFRLVSVREEPEWELFLLPDNTGKDRIVIWNGSTIEPVG